MGKNGGPLLDPSVIVEDIEIEGAGRIGLAPLAPERTF
jgi:hypothetical protein